MRTFFLYRYLKNLKNFLKLLICFKLIKYVHNNAMKCDNERCYSIYNCGKNKRIWHHFFETKFSQQLDV